MAQSSYETTIFKFVISGTNNAFNFGNENSSDSPKTIFNTNKKYE